MPILTDSYCERCGTRYVFNEPAPKRPSIKSARVLARGLKNFVLTDGQSMGESLALARTDDDHEDSTRTTEAFYRTFNFCMTCRQYACDKCWNVKQGVCLTCSPDAELLPIAPEERLIVQTPVSRYETDHAALAYPATPESVQWPEADPLVASLPSAVFIAPLAGAHPGGRRGLQGDETADAADPMSWAASMAAPEPPEPLDPMSWGKPAGAAEPAAPTARKRPKADWTIWPVTEERETASAGAAGAAVPTQAAMKPATETPAAVVEPDQEVPAVVTSTPVVETAPARALASEVSGLALTPSELMLVEAELGQAEPNEPIAEPAPITQPETLHPAPIPWTAAHTLAEDAALPPVRRPLLSNAIADEPKRAAASWEPESPSQIRGNDAPASQEPRHTPSVTRLFGRGPATPQPERRSASQASEPWPHPTAWSDRPITPHDWFGDGQVPASAAATTSIEWASAPAAQPPAVEPSALVAQPVPVDSLPQTRLPETAAEAVDLRAAALAQVGFETTQADQSPLFDFVADRADPSPAPSPVARPAADQTSTPPADPRISGEQAARGANPWPPLGASWPSAEQSGGPWHVPENASVPAAIAAQQAAEPQTNAVWAQSSQEVLNRGSVRVCHKCALPVSTHARFCRRCGTQQA